MDGKENLYVVGEVTKNRDLDSSRFYVLEKYSTKGKRLWSKKLKGYATNIAVINKSVYVFDYEKLQARCTFTGKRKSLAKKSDVMTDKKGNISIFGQKIEKKTVKSGKYLPEGLPNKEEKIDAYIEDYATDKRSNIYLIGSEVFYPSGECGNVEEVKGALIAKLNSKGKTVWAKVIDRNE